MSTIKINELATTDIALTDFIAKADANGLMTKNTISNLSTFISTIGSVAFKGSVLIADNPTEDGWYLAGEAGTFPNIGGLVALAQSVTIFVISGSDTIYSKIDIPITIPAYDSTPTSGSTNPVESGGVLDFYKVGNTQTVKFEKAIGSFVSTPQSPITTNTISVDLTNSINGAPICIYYKGNVLTKNSFTGAVPTFFNGVNVLNELCEIWMIYNNVSNSLSVNINSGFTGTVPRIIIPQEPVYTSQNLIKTNNNYLNNTSNSWVNTETSTTAMGNGDFEYSIDLIEASKIGKLQLITMQFFKCL